MIKGLAHKFPAASLSALNMAAAAICALIGHSEYVPVLVAAAAMFLGLHTQVVPKRKAADNVAKAAVDAATTTAANLTKETVGKLGEVTEGATKVVTNAVGLVKGLLT